jgi:hypothetical protein
MMGTFRGNGKWFVTRHARKTLRDPSERIHDSAEIRSAKVPVARPGRGFLRLSQLR